MKERLENIRSHSKQPGFENISQDRAKETAEEEGERKRPTIAVRGERSLHTAHPPGSWVLAHKARSKQQRRTEYQLIVWSELCEPTYLHVWQ